MKIQVLNNKGNTLIIVLLITAVFTILFLSFIGISANTNKQNEKGEEISQSVALAEMGVEYYEEAILNIIKNYRIGEAKNTVDSINNYIKTQISEKKSVDQNKIDSEINSLMLKIVTDITNFLDSNKNRKLLNGHEFKSLVSGPSAHSDRSWTWSISVEGKPHLSSSSQKIAAKYTLLESDIIKRPSTNGDSDDESSQNLSLPTLPPQILATENKKENLNVGSFDGNGNYVTDAVISDLNNAKIHAIGNVTIKNLNGMKSMEIIANSTVTLQEAIGANHFTLHAGSANFNNLNSLNNSTINIYGTAIMKNVKNVNNSHININGYGEMDAVDPITNSSINIFGNAKINSLENLSNSTVFIQGNLDVYNKIQINNAGSSIFVGGKLSVTQANSEISNGTVVVNQIEVAGTNKASFKVNSNGKLCVKDLNSLSQFSNQKIKGTGSGHIIFLDSNLDKDKKIHQKDYPAINNSDLTGSHNYVMGIDAFNTACGITGTTNSNLEDYEVSLDPLKILSDINY